MQPDRPELAEQEALVAAIDDLDRDAGAQNWKEPDRQLVTGNGRNLSRSMEGAGLTVTGLAERSGLDLSDVIAYVHGVEDLRLEEMLRLAWGPGIGLESLLAWSALPGLIAIG